MENSILFTVDENNIGRLTLNRPDVHNAFNNEMVQRLTDHLRKIHEDPTLRALVIRGNGPSFCAGADLAWMERASKFTEEENFEDARLLSLMMYFLDVLPIPTLTYVQGAVLGGGVGMIACSDIVISDPQTLFSFSEVKMGLLPAVISPYILRAIGSRYSRRYFLTGEKFDATTAHQMGLIHEIVDPENQEAAIDNLLRHILSGGPSAVLQAKKLIQQLMPEVTEAQRLMTIELIAQVRRSEEGLQGIRAFLTKKSPPWVSNRPLDD